MEVSKRKFLLWGAAVVGSAALGLKPTAVRADVGMYYCPYVPAEWTKEVVEFQTMSPLQYAIDRISEILGVDGRVTLTPEYDGSGSMFLSNPKRDPRDLSTDELLEINVLMKDANLDAVGMRVFGRSRFSNSEIINLLPTHVENMTPMITCMESSLLTEPDYDDNQLGEA